MTSALSIDIDQHGTVADDLGAATVQAVFGDDDAEFNGHVNSWFDRFQPATPQACELVRNAASLSWELEEIGRTQKARRAQRMEEAVKACGYGTLEQIERAKAIASFDPSMDGERLRRHRLSVHRELRRDLESIAKLKQQSEKRNPKEDGSRESEVESRESGVGSRDASVRRGSHDTADRRSPGPGQGVDVPRAAIDIPRAPIRITPIETVPVPRPEPNPRTRSQGSGGKRRPEPKRLFKEHRSGTRSKADEQSEQARHQRRMTMIRDIESSLELGRGLNGSLSIAISP
jgi:hypothetical protein